MQPDRIGTQAILSGEKATHVNRYGLLFRCLVRKQQASFIIYWVWVCLGALYTGPTASFPVIALALQERSVQIKESVIALNPSSAGDLVCYILPVASVKTFTTHLDAQDQIDSGHGRENHHSSEHFSSFAHHVCWWKISLAQSYTFSRSHAMGHFIH